MILDAAILISIDRGERAAQAFLNAAVRQDWFLATTEPVIAQVWRQGSRQARRAAFLNTIDAAPLDDGREVGVLVAVSNSADAVDAHLVAVASRLQRPILTSDVGDFSQLCAPLGARAPKIMEWPQSVQ